MEALTREFQDAGQPSFRIWGEGKELLVFKMDGPPTQKDKKPKRRRTSMGNLGKSFGAHLSIAKFKESETLALAWRLRLELGENGVVTIVPIRPVAVTAVTPGPVTDKIPPRVSFSSEEEKDKKSKKRKGDADHLPVGKGRRDDDEDDFDEEEEEEEEEEAEESGSKKRPASKSKSKPKKKPAVQSQKKQKKNDLWEHWPMLEGSSERLEEENCLGDAYEDTAADARTTATFRNSVSFVNGLLREDSPVPFEDWAIPVDDNDEEPQLKNPVDQEPCMNQQQLDIPDTGCDKAHVKQEAIPVEEPHLKKP
ncbi:unnamed protein product, partial [Symbiodinium microadriaticum]